MARPTVDGPTDGELLILTALWRLGPSTVRQIHAHLGRTTGYTSVLKLLQIMTEKGLVIRAESPPPARSHIFSPAQPLHTTQKQLLRNLVDKAFFGSAAAMVIQALSSHRASAEELQQIRDLLDQQKSRRHK